MSVFIALSRSLLVLRICYIRVLLQLIQIDLLLLTRLDLNFLNQLLQLLNFIVEGCLLLRVEILEVLANLLDLFLAFVFDPFGLLLVHFAAVVVVNQQILK